VFVIKWCFLSVVVVVVLPKKKKKKLHLLASLVVIMMGLLHEKDSGDPSQTIKHAPLQDIPKGVTIDTLSWVPKYYTFRVRGIV
jgi:hypothetical protein